MIKFKIDMCTLLHLRAVAKSLYEGGNLTIMSSATNSPRTTIFRSEFLNHVLYLISLCNHAFFIYHLLVVVLLNDVQLATSIWTSIFSVQDISHLFSSFIADVRILQSFYKYFNYRTTKDYAGFKKDLLLKDKFPFRFTLGYSKHIYDS
jgi:hypothetical protein